MPRKSGKLGNAEYEFLKLWQATAPDFPQPEPQYEFAKKEMGRKWAADFCWPGYDLIVEIQGGVWMKTPGGHTSGAGYTRDCERMNAAQELGYRILYYTPQMVRDSPDQVVEQVKRFLDA
jgi:very-short-patch-repair endonuclease